METVAATHCLDACAVMAYLRHEAGAEVLKGLIEQPTTFLAMHVCNLGEVYFVGRGVLVDGPRQVGDPPEKPSRY